LDWFFGGGEMKICRMAKMALGMLIVAVLLGGAVPQGLATVDWYYWSPLTVIESISDIGAGEYRYEYSFVNVDTSPIWLFGVYTTFVNQDVITFTGYEAPNEHELGWLASATSMDDAATVYDGRNLDSNIVAIAGTWTNPFEDSYTAMPLNDAVSGFSFTASVYDPSQKYYLYETIASGYTDTNGTGKVAAVGQTIPEPATLLLLGLGGLVLTRRKR
jgi:hypothetical protein